VKRIFPSPSQRLLWYWLPVAAFCVAIFVQSAFPSPAALPSWPYSDKVLHAGVYALLAVLWARALNSHTRWRGRLKPLFIGAAIFAALFGLSDEWHQSFVIERTADILDWLADAIGAALGAWLYLRWVL
jgi:VanZ family protein